MALQAKKHLHLYLISDASGETVVMVGEAAYRRFLALETTEYVWPLVRSKEQIDNLIEAVLQNPGVVLHSIVDSKLRLYLEMQCHLHHIPQICPVDGILEVISNYTNLLPDKLLPGKHSSLDAEYYRKINSINFTAEHDDGQKSCDYEDADIVILGVSRTSKTPTAFYLAHRGYKVANMPIVSHHDYTALVGNLHHPLLVGFTISSQRLSEIRAFRFNNDEDIDKGKMRHDDEDHSKQSVCSGGCNFQHDMDASIKSNHAKHDDSCGCDKENYIDNYISLETIRAELNYANSIFKKLDISVIDVGNKAVEEVAGQIINMFADHRGSHVKE
jgi:[pyruvate, water dikinase]-phosphate phosphotransferase / [pyruvate, water dikinase] kinase